VGRGFTHGYQEILIVPCLTLTIKMIDDERLRNGFRKLPKKTTSELCAVTDPPRDHHDAAGGSMVVLGGGGHLGGRRGRGGCPESGAAGQTVGSART